MNAQRLIPRAVAIGVGLLTLVALLLNIPALSGLILDWAIFLAAVAFVIGILNLLAVHLGRFFRERNPYSFILVLSLIAIIIIGLADAVGATDGVLPQAFALVQQPLEAAFASLLAIFLLTAVFRLLQVRRTAGTVLFMLTILFVLFSSVSSQAALLPAAVNGTIQQARTLLDQIVITSGVRGLLLGIALGTITLSIRLLFGADRPYSE